MDPKCAVLDPTSQGDEDSEDSNSDSTSLITLKALISAAMFVEMMIGTVLPLFVLKFKRYHLYLALLNCFSGGVFLSTGRCLLSGESTRNIDFCIHFCIGCHAGVDSAMWLVLLGSLNIQLLVVVFLNY